eukprot:CAMPEP_0177793492 /NCGR_PEP_ID=MMETSP0491_2-20121128/25104_1 /TAXON_ID=63592 /ORGANISM="Tetraselmis chuii, Strain PLY429" /LENGTH=74 /DNA_ID=CAMNT_0019316011 /DNA_START=132 /DNA_END=356 /DNA_ORIENTATION=+
MPSRVAFRASSCDGSDPMMTICNAGGPSHTLLSVLPPTAPPPPSRSDVVHGSGIERGGAAAPTPRAPLLHGTRL